MKKERKKPRFPKLSIKIILTLFAVLFVISAVLNIFFSIFQAAGMVRPENPENIDAWMRLVIVFFGLIMSSSVLVLFAFIINKTVVRRICKLEEATDEVAKGNLGVIVEVKGKDELSDLTESFNRMSAELKANEYLSKEFIRDVSHEFKTPISAIRAYGELLDCEADKEIVDKIVLKEYARIITTESDRLAILIKSIMQLSVLDSTTMIKKEDIFKPSEQVREILRLTQMKYTEKNLTLDLALEEITITNNGQLLYQVWQNLISNAIKFSNPNGIIKIILTRNGEKGIYFEITDNGIGIKDADKEKLFNHFYMADTSRNAEGNGLGLAITKRILSKVDGEIGFDSTEGTGSRFYVRI